MRPSGMEGAWVVIVSSAFSSLNRREGAENVMVAPVGGGFGEPELTVIGSSD
jgi:hypothetical protein